MLCFRLRAHLLKSAQCRVNAFEVFANGPCSNGVVLGVCRRFGKISVAQSEDHRRICYLLTYGALRRRFGSLAQYFAALVVEVLSEGPSSVVGDVVEFCPKPVQLLLTFFIQ